MKIEQMKEFIWVAKNPIEWEILDNPTFDRFNGSEVSIHKKHKEVLDHVLSGGEVLINFKGTNLKLELEGFIKYYNSEYTYEIIPTKEDKSECNLCNDTKIVKYLDENDMVTVETDCPNCRHEPKVECITRKSLLEAIQVNLQDANLFTEPLDVRLVELIQKVADRLEYLEANQKDK